MNTHVMQTTGRNKLKTNLDIHVHVCDSFEKEQRNECGLLNNFRSFVSDAGSVSLEKVIHEIYNMS